MRLGLTMVFASILTLALVVACSDDDSKPTPDGGGCATACGPNASCAAALCACAAGWSDCNGDIGKAGGDGCECSQACNGAVCGSAPTTCKPSVVNDCQDKQRFCDRTAGSCKPCPAGKYNCDGVDECESSTDCSAGGCELFGAKTCGSQSTYCDAATKTCKPCASGTYNCSLNGGDCECTVGCDGTACKKECTAAAGCNDTSKFCDFGSCKACPTGTFNCNNKDDCECTGTGCDGTACKGTTTCDYSDANVCGGDTSKWCWQGACKACTTGWFNCNTTKGCECDSQGCNGAVCAGSCSGGECP